VNRKQTGLWIGLFVSGAAAFYSGMSFVFYAWMSAAAPDRWPPDRAGLWAGAAALLCGVFLVTFVYCIFALIRDANRKT
jgi:hypothetical protein